MEDSSINNGLSEEYPRCVICGAVFHLNCLKTLNETSVGSLKCCPICGFAAPMDFWIRLGKKSIELK